MKVLVIGSGGREHALIWKLAQSAEVSKLWCAPGNAGMARERLMSNHHAVVGLPAKADDLPALLHLAEEKQPDLTVVGPDNPLGSGIVDLFQERGLRIWGPNKKAARFESSKAFSQQFMEQYGIPTARSGVFSEVAPAKAYARELPAGCVVKSDGLAMGKGVLICHHSEQADAAINAMMVEKKLGEAGARIVIQELLTGTEVSLHALCDGQRSVLFPTSQDHKRALDGDKGLNTGGMGAYSPAPFLSPRQLEQIQMQILDPWLAGCQQEGIRFSGMLYPGLMLTEEGPKVLEFNARFGDPEAQVYVTRLENDLLDLLEACVDGDLGRVSLRWSLKPSICVVLASDGYPGSYEKGKPITGLREVDQIPNIKVFHAGTSFDGEAVLTNGGRVLGVTAWADTLTEARNSAYSAIDQIHFTGMRFRKDIGQKALD